MINTYYQLKVTTLKGEKLLLTFIDTDTMFDAHLEAVKMGYDTDYYDTLAHGYMIMRKEADYMGMLNSFK